MACYPSIIFLLHLGKHLGGPTILRATYISTWPFWGRAKYNETKLHSLIHSLCFCPFWLSQAEATFLYQHAVSLEEVPHWAPVRLREGNMLFVAHKCAPAPSNTCENPLASWPGGLGRRWAVGDHTTLLSYGPIPTVEGSRGWATQNGKRDMYFSRLRFGCFHPEHLLISYVFLGTWLNLFKPQFPCLENVVNSRYLAGCLLIPGAEKNGWSYDDIVGWYIHRGAQVIQCGGHPRNFSDPDRGNFAGSAPRYCKVIAD